MKSIQFQKWWAWRWQRTINLAHQTCLMVVYDFETLILVLLPVERYLLLGFYLYPNMFMKINRLHHKFILQICQILKMYQLRTLLPTKIGRKIVDQLIRLFKDIPEYIWYFFVPVIVNYFIIVLKHFWRPTQHYLQPPVEIYLHIQVVFCDHIFLLSPQLLTDFIIQTLTIFIQSFAVKSVRFHLDTS